jgi:hypothetical protein
MNNEQKLPKDFKAKFVAALRSGKYKQGKDYMYNASSDSYCCLGVAGRVCGIDNKILDGNAFFMPNDNGVVGTQYPDVLMDRWAELAGMNDGGDSFDEIADWIEANL